MYIVYVRTVYTQSADSAVSSSMDSSAQHRGSEAEPDSNGEQKFSRPKL